ncbi:MAG TPA: isopentenyl-diphosphate Delta-isomerase [Mycobacteriales bacterium]|nr:isopentenyl-diphosphate Delta-isomerase [Mycobacteriales bacterium]
MTANPTSPERWVELVDSDGAPVGACPVDEAHRAPGLLHRAFSVLLFDPAGRILLQRRALDKSRFGGLWSNTCCSHPAPGESPCAAAARRLAEELGMAAPGLTDVGVYRYYAADPGGVWVEREHDHVLVGRTSADPEPAPSEVDSWRWADVPVLHAELAERPELFTPWFAGVLRIAVTSAAS